MNRSLILLATTCWLLEKPVNGQDGTLDGNFDADGIVTTSVSNGFITSIVQQPDGRIIAAGSVIGGTIVLRYNPDGSPDNSFGSANGYHIVPGLMTCESCDGVILLPDGKLLLVGGMGPGGDIGIARLTSNGSMDSGYGVGGIVSNDLGTAQDVAWSGAVQDDGKIVVVGRVLNGELTEMVTARFNANGTPDLSFSFDGRVVIAFNGATNDVGVAVRIQPDGKILVAGRGNDVFALVRFTPDGVLDDTFGTGGKITEPIFPGESCQLESMALQSDGRIIVAGSNSGISGHHFAMARFTSDGIADDSFGTAGKVMTLISPEGDSGQAVSVAADGKIVVAGWTGGGSGFAAVRYTSDGLPDPSFGTDGVVITSVGDGGGAYAACVQSDGNILVAGSSYEEGTLSATILRYTGSLSIGISGLTRTATQVHAYPVPASGRVTLECSIGTNERVSAAIYDGFGTLVRLVPLAQGAGLHREVLDLQGLAAGCYIVHLSGTCLLASVRIMVI